MTRWRWIDGFGLALWTAGLHSLLATAGESGQITTGVGAALALIVAVAAASGWRARLRAAGSTLLFLTGIAAAVLLLFRSVTGFGLRPVSARSIDWLVSGLGLDSTVCATGAIANVGGVQLELAPGAHELAVPVLVTLAAVWILRAADIRGLRRIRWEWVPVCAVALLVVALGRWLATLFVGAELDLFVPEQAGAPFLQLLFGDPVTIGFGVALGWIGHVLESSLSNATDAHPNPARVASRDGSASRISPLPASALALLVVSAGYLFAVPDVGDIRPGRVLVDDSHCEDWEVAGAAFVPDWRGDMSVYACSAVFESLGSRFHVRFNRRDAIDDQLLTDVDVLVLKVPSRPYSASEVAAVHRFVRSGGGVLAIGDHTDLFGCNTSLNAVLAPTGMRLNSDSVVHFRGSQPESSWYLTRGWLREPLDRMVWLSGCSVSVPADAEVLVGAGAAYADHADFSRPSFFGDHTADPAETGGGVAQVAAASLGDGRVVVLTDGTLHTNFAGFRPGHLELLERCLAYANTRPSEGRALGWIALALAFGLTWLVRAGGASLGSPMSAASLAIVLFVSGSELGELVGTRLVKAPPGAAHRPVAAFLAVHADYHLAPTIGGSSLPHSASYDTLFVEVARHGFTPRFRRSLDAALQAECVIIPNIAPTLSELESARFSDYVRAGGCLWVLGSEVKSSLRGLTRLAAAFASDDGASAAGQFAVEGRLVHSAVIDREERDASHTVVFSVGEGLLVLTTNSEALSRAELGHPFPAPTTSNQSRYDLVTDVLQRFATSSGTAAARWETTVVSGVVGDE